MKKTKNDDDFEKEFFEDDNSKINIIKLAVVILAILLIAIIGIMIVRKESKKRNNDKNDLQESLIDYSEKEDEDIAIPSPEAIPENESSIIDRNDDEVDEVIKEELMSPSPTPFVPEPTPDGPVMELNVKNYSKVKYDAKVNLKEMELYFADSNLKAIDDLAHLDRFIAMSYALKGTEDFKYFGDVNSQGKPDGKGVAVYADNQYYYGDWKDGLRDGTGIWVHFHIHLKKDNTDHITYHQYQGGFKNDLPSGEGQDHYEYDITKFKGTDRYITNYIGSFKDGLINGDMYCTATNSGGEYADFEGKAENGKFIYLSESRDKQYRGPVMINRENPDDYIWLSPVENQNIGVKSYISSHK